MAKDISTGEYEDGFYRTVHPKRLGKLLVHYDLYKRAMNIDGDIVECGVFKGNSLFWLSSFSTLFNDGRTVYGLDTFSKFPRTNNDLDNEFIEQFSGALGDPVSNQSILGSLNARGISNVKTIVGNIKSTIPQLIKKGVRLSILHIDVDVYCATKTALSLYDNVSVGGVVILDDYKMVPGATKAIDEFVETRGVKIFSNPFHPSPHYIIKEA